MVSPMSLCTVLPSTPRLDELLASISLDEQSPLPVDGETVLYQYALPVELELEIKKEVLRRVCIKLSPLRVMLITVVRVGKSALR